MGVSRYSRDPKERRWQMQFDELQGRCQVDYYSPTISKLIDHGIAQVKWECRNRGCWHSSEAFDLSRFGRNARVRNLWYNYVCSECGTNRPHLRLLYGGERV